MKKLVLAVVLFAAFGLGLPAMAKEAPKSIEGVTLVDAAAAKALLDKGAIFVDVRTPDLWEAGRIPGAVWLELFTDYNEASLQKVANKNDDVVIYCMGPG